MQYDDKYDELRDSFAKNHTPDEVKFVEKAYKTAKKAHEQQKRFSGEPYIMHPVAVAQILCDLGMDSKTLAAALLHDTVEDTDIDLEYIRKNFGDETADLVDGVTKLGKVPLATKEETQAENIRKMLLAMSQDIRVIIIKLADRLHNMRTLEFMREQKRRDKAVETLEIYAPIAHRLGMRTIKEELEDLSIKYLDPIAYHEIGDILSETEEDNSDFIPETIEEIRSKIDETIGGATYEGRVKSIHGIYRKMYMQGKNFNEIYDIFAIRIIVNDVGDCYAALGLIHEMYHPIPNRFKDYISMPKPNMYQSLHTTVIRNGLPFEVQIRTYEMHYTAEYGIAAHWKYKLGMNGEQKAQVDSDTRISWIRQLLDNQKDSGDIEDIVSTIKTDFVSGDVFAFTPMGKVIDIPAGATVIDFAYVIHTEVGNHMIGAKVNGRIVPLDYKVKTGDIVEILTSSQPGKGPSRDWLGIVTTANARSKIRAWFRKEKRPENITEGRAAIDKELRRNNIKLYDEDLGEFLHKLCVKEKCANTDDFYAAIGYGSISVDKLMPYIKDEYAKLMRSRNVPEVNIVNTQRKVSSGSGVIVEGIDNCLIKFSHCCDPLPGDEIIGFITRGHGVSIHKRDCRNVPLIIEHSAEPERWVTAYWDKKEEEKDYYRATLSVWCDDRIGILASVTAMLASMHVNINNITTKDSPKESKTTVYLTISVKNREQLKTVAEKIDGINGVISVERTGLT
jgi:guanosine-3',5'-bis(diphosphate) 3'-pyrophosphohydrolase